MFFFSKNYNIFKYSNYISLDSIIVMILLALFKIEKFKHINKCISILICLIV